MWREGHQSYQHIIFFFRVASFYIRKMKANVELKMLESTTSAEILALDSRSLVTTVQAMHNLGVTLFFLTDEKVRTVEILKNAVVLNPMCA